MGNSSGRCEGVGRQMCGHDSAAILIPDISACACVYVRSHSGAASPAAAGTNQPQPSASQFASMQRESFLSCDSLNPASTRRLLTLSSRHRQTSSDLLKYFGRLETAQPGRKVSLSHPSRVSQQQTVSHQHIGYCGRSLTSSRSVLAAPHTRKQVGEPVVHLRMC